MIYNLIAIIILCIEVVMIVLFAVHAYKSKVIISKKNIWYFLPVLLLLFVLYMTGYYYKDGTINFLKIAYCINASLRTFTFEIKGEYIERLLEQNQWYFIAFYLAFFMASFTMINAAMSVFGNKIRNKLRLIKLIRNGCDIVLGESKTALTYIKENPNSILWITEKTKDEDLSFYYKNKLTIIEKPFSVKTMKNFRFQKQKEYHFIAFEYNEKELLLFINEFQSIKCSNESILFLHLEVNYNQVEVMNDQFIATVKTEANSFINTFCRHELIARKFIMDYPFTKFIPQSVITNNGCIVNDYEINVFMLGFGKVNLELMKMMIMNNQFVQEGKTGFEAHQVNYYAYDYDSSKQNNKVILRLLDDEWEGISLPKPEKICNFHYEVKDIKSLEMIKTIKEKLHPNSFNFIFISFDQDFDNAELSLYINTKLKKHKNYKIFCRSKNNEITNSSCCNESIIYFGNEKDIINHDVIADEKLSQLARKINQTYNSIGLSKIENIRNWERLPLIRQYSNIYSAVNIRFKLNLMGLDYSTDASLAISKEEYYKRYLVGKEVKISYDNYDDYFLKTLRNALAYYEHLRWNAFYLLHGYEQMMLSKITYVKDKHSYNVKDEQRKEHACLTTYYGLDILYKYILEKSVKEKTNLKLFEIESYRYDYMVCDNLYDQLISIGFYIIKKKL